MVYISYDLKRTIIMVETGIGMIVTIILMFIAIALALNGVEIFPPSPGLVMTIEAVIGTIVIVAIFAFGINFLGFFGAWKGHYCPICTYTVILVIGAIAGLINIFVSSPVHIISFIIASFLAYISYELTSEIGYGRINPPPTVSPTVLPTMKEGSTKSPYGNPTTETITKV